MKKFRKISYIVLIIIIIVLSFTIYTNANKDDNKDIKNKTFSEIKFLETKLSNLLNSMNNVELRNYKISYGEISKEQEQESEGQSESSSSQESSGKEKSNSQQSSSSSTESDSGNQKEEKFDLKKSGVLNNSDEINWENVKSEIETLYTSIPNITLDLYKVNLNQEDVLGFNREFDNLTTVARDENKEETLLELSKLYEYIPKFAKNTTDDELLKKIFETKSNIFKAYSKLDNKKWDEIDSDINNAVNVYSQLLTNTNIDSKKQYSINKAYIMINELKNSVSMKDETVFLIKYKNLLEELNNM